MAFPNLLKRGQSKSSSVRSSFDDFFYGSRVPKAEEGEQRGHVLNNNRRAASVDLPHPQWEHKIIRELHRKELARDHPRRSFEAKSNLMRLFDDDEEERKNKRTVRLLLPLTTTNSWNKPVF